MFLTATRRVAANARGYACRACGVSVEDERINELFAERNIGAASKDYARCRKLKSAGEFEGYSDCALYKSISRVSLAILQNRKPTDVVACDLASSTVYLETLLDSPEGDHGDRRGDHGKEVSRIIGEIHEKGALQTPGSLVDIGGMNTSTIKRLDGVLGGGLEALLVEISRITPALIEPDDRIRYAIGDIIKLLADPTSVKAIQDQLSDKPTLFIMDNFINVHEPSTAWEIIKNIWDVVVADDHVFLLGLHPSQFEDGKMFIPKEMLGGIEAFHYQDGRFYKSAIHSEPFETHLIEGLEGSEIVESDAAHFEIKPSPRGKITTKVSSVWFLIKKAKS